MNRSLGFLVAIVATEAFAEEPLTNPEYTFSLEGPCGQTVEGVAGTDYDDGTGGGPDFQNGRPGHTWNVLLTIGEAGGPTIGWHFGIGTEGPAMISDVTLNGTVIWSFFQAGVVLAELTGLPYGVGPQTLENHGALSGVVLCFDNSCGPLPGATYLVCKIRVFAGFPEIVGETTRARIFFGTRTGSGGIPVSPSTFGNGTVTAEEGNPPLRLQDCEVRFRAVAPVADFLRCDANADGNLDISDPIWILNELFGGGHPTGCPKAGDCNDDGKRDISDAVYALAHEFLGGPAPPSPFPSCGSLPELRPEDCPAFSTNCPR